MVTHVACFDFLCFLPDSLLGVDVFDVDGVAVFSSLLPSSLLAGVDDIASANAWAAVNFCGVLVVVVVVDGVVVFAAVTGSTPLLVAVLALVLLVPVDDVDDDDVCCALFCCASNS